MLRVWICDETAIPLFIHEKYIDTSPMEVWDSDVFMGVGRQQMQSWLGTERFDRPYRSTEIGTGITAICAIWIDGQYREESENRWHTICRFSVRRGRDCVPKIEWWLSDHSAVSARSQHNKSN